MLRFFLTRLSLVVPTFIGITLLVFVLIRLIPGDPIETMAGERGIDPARLAQLRKEYGFDQPVLVQRHTSSPDANPLFGGPTPVGIGVSGTFTDTSGVMNGTALVGKASQIFGATLRKLADSN